MSEFNGIEYSSTIPLSELADVQRGVSLTLYRPNKKDLYDRTVLYYQGASCTNALYGKMPPPSTIDVGSKFSDSSGPSKVLATGDILIPRTFKNFGCGIYDGSYDECYPSQVLVVINGRDRLTHDYLSVFFRSEVGEEFVREISTQTKAFGMSSVNLKQLRQLQVPVLTEEQMKDVFRTYEEKRIAVCGTSEDRSQNVSYTRKTELLLKSQLAQKELELKGLKSELKELKALKQEPQQPNVDKLVNLARDVEKFLKSANEAGMVSVVTGAKVCVGKEHSVHVTTSGTSILENNMTEGILVYKKSGRKVDILFSDRIGEADIEKFQTIANIALNNSQPSFYAMHSEKQRGAEL